MEENGNILRWQRDRKKIRDEERKIQKKEIEKNERSYEIRKK